MPTIFSHAVFAGFVGKAFSPEKTPNAVFLLAAVCSIIPDADVLAFVFRIPYENMFGHRGFTHSIVFAFLWGAVCALAVNRFWRTEISFIRLFALFTFSTLSHPLLDMLTSGGLGVALFAPLSNERFFFPWRPVRVSPIGAGFFSARGVQVILSELLWIGLPSVFILILSILARRILARRQTVRKKNFEA